LIPFYHLVCLGLAVLIGVIHIALQAISATRDTGVKWNAGARDTPAELGVMAGRLERASHNFRESFPLFAASLLGAYLAAQLSDLTLVAAVTYVVARAVYIPLYAFGVPYLRSLVWVISLVAILVILAALLL
jgi:uncharacterized MAPEG superfamily protein